MKIPVIVASATTTSKIVYSETIRSKMSQNTFFRDSMSFQATVAGTGAVTLGVLIECSNDEVAWKALPSGTLALSGTTQATDMVAFLPSFHAYRISITGIGGTGALGTITLGG